MQKNDVLQKSIDIIQNNFPNLIGIYLFGSYANKTHSKESDLDIAILSRQKIDQGILWAVAQKIAVAINKDVDLVDLAEASTVFQTQIIHDGIKIEAKDRKACDAFEDLVYAKYVRLNDLRSDIIKDIHERGTIH